MPVAAVPSLFANPALLGAAISGAGALGQGIASAFTARKRKEAEKALEAEVDLMKVPESITDIYNKNLARYSPNAYQSARYTEAMRQARATEAGALASSQTRRGGLMALPSIVQATNLASQRAAGAAEAAQAQELAQLGGAAGALAQQQNLIRQAKLNLMAQKAAAYAGTQNVREQGALNSLGNAATLAMYAFKPDTKTVS